MKVTRKVPETFGVPVYVTGTHYEIWYSKPVKLGKIVRQGAYWYTVDGQQHVSSRSAMRYLIQLHENGMTPKEQDFKAPTAAPKTVIRRKLTTAGASKTANMDAATLPYNAKAVDMIVSAVLKELDTRTAPTKDKR